MTIALICLLLTIAIETGLAWLLAGRLWPKTAWTRLRTDVPLANLFTQPLAFYAIAVQGGNFMLFELVVIAVECVIYRVVTGMSWGTALLVSLVLNLPTLFVAMILFA